MGNVVNPGHAGVAWYPFRGLGLRDDSGVRGVEICARGLGIGGGLARA